MSAFDGLVSAALIGTDRRAPEAPEVGGALGEALAGQPWSASPAAAVLVAAALAAIHRRAGALPTTVGADALPSAAPAEAAAVCPPGAATLLRRLLADADGRAALPEWLERVHARGERAPFALLPDLLDIGNDDRELQANLLPAIGSRGLWLAAQHPEWWTWAVPQLAARDPAASATASEDPWLVGSLELRVAELARLRATEPETARALIESTWAQDPPGPRARFIAALRPGLGPQDEPLLERALADGRKEVRAEAIALLSALDGSAYRERMAARLRPLVSVTGTLRRRLAVALPGELDPAAKRDGLRAAQRDGLGPQSALLADLVASAGLAFWTTAGLGAETPADVLRLARGTDHEKALRLGWQTAAAREREPAWCVALAVQDHLPALLSGLPAAVAEPAALELLGTAGKPEQAWLAWALFDALDGPWSTAFSTAAIRLVADGKDGGIDRPMQRTVGRRLNAASLADAAARLSRRPDGAPSLDALRHLLDLRQSLIRELPTP